MRWKATTLRADGGFPAAERYDAGVGPRRLPAQAKVPRRRNEGTYGFATATVIKPEPVTRREK